MTYLWTSKLVKEKNNTMNQFNNWNNDCENIVNEQIQLEYWASYQYHMIWSYFDRSEVGLNNIAAFFKKNSQEERDHAEKLMSYQNTRGGKVKLNGIMSVDLLYLEDINDNTNDILSSFEKALKMEDIVYKSLLKVHKMGEDKSDPQFCDFIEGEFLKEQVHAMNEISKYISQLKRIDNNGYGLWSFDQNLKV